MADLKTKGDLAEAMVFADLLKRGYKVALPYGEDWDYDLIVVRRGRFERVHEGDLRSARCLSHQCAGGSSTTRCQMLRGASCLRPSLRADCPRRC